MADQQSTHASLSSAVNIYYTKNILKDFEEGTQFYSLAPIKEPIPQGAGNKVEFTRYKKVPYLYSDNTDQFTAQQMYLSASTLQATLHERDGYIQLSRFTCLTAIGKPLQQAANKIKTAARRTVDILVRNDIGFAVADKATYSAGMFNNLGIDGGTLNSSGITARLWVRRADGFPMYHNKTRVAQSATVVSIAKSGMTVKTIQHAVSVLEGKNVDHFDGGNYHAIIHSDVAYQVTTLAGFKGWFSPTTTEPVVSNPTVLGTIAGVKFMRSNLAWKFPLSGDTLSTSSGNLYATLLFGQEAYGCSQIQGENGRKGFSFFLKESGPQTTSDPTNMKKQAAFSITAVGRVLNKSAGLLILTTEKV